MKVKARVRWDEYHDYFLRQSLAEGHTPVEIAKALGRDRQSVLKRMGRLGISWRACVARLEKKEEPAPIEAPEPDGETTYDPLADALMKAGYKKEIPKTKLGDFAPVMFHPERRTGLGQWD